MQTFKHSLNAQCLENRCKHCGFDWSSFLNTNWKVNRGLEDETLPRRLEGTIIFRQQVRGLTPPQQKTRRHISRAAANLKRHIQHLCLLTCLALSGAALAADALTDDQICEQIVQESIQAYPGNCPCPFNSDRAGRRCGGRSAWSRAGGHSPICYAKEVTGEQISQYRAKHGNPKP